MMNLNKRFQSLSHEELQETVGGGKGICKYVYPGANGYACTYPNGEWGYIVTKGYFETVKDVMVNGWISSLGGGYFHPSYRG